MLHRKVIYNSILIAIYISITCVVSIINSIIVIPNISALLSFGILISAIIINQNKKISTSALIYYISIFIILIISLVRYGGWALNYLSYYVLFATTSFVLSNLKDFSAKIIANTSLYIYALFLLLYFTTIQATRMASDDFGSEQMGYAYMSLPGVLWAYSVIIFPKLYIGNRIYGFLLSSFVFLGNLYIIFFQTMTRGAIISVLAGMFLILLIKAPIKLRSVLFITIIILGTLLIVNIDLILEHILGISMDTSIGALNKLSRMAEGGDISNGRDELYNYAISLFKNKPALGWGIGYYENIYNIYSHQFFLQMLCEFGILGSIIFVIPLLKNLRLLFFCKRYSIFIVEIILVCSTLIMLMFSNVYWFVPQFWFLFFMSKNYIISQEVLEEQI